MQDTRTYVLQIHFGVLTPCGLYSVLHGYVRVHATLESCVIMRTSYALHYIIYQCMRGYIPFLKDDTLKTHNETNRRT